MFNKLWAARLTGNQEKRLLEVLGSVDLTFKDALVALDRVEIGQFKYTGELGTLRQWVMEAAERAGETGQSPLVDQRLADSLRGGRFVR